MNRNLEGLVLQKKRFAWECEAFFVFGWKRWIFMYQLIFTKFHKK